MLRVTGEGARVGRAAAASPRRKKPAVRYGEQLELEAVVRPKKRGGKRVGAGRKRPPGTRSSVPHTRRERHLARHPVHVTLRARGRLPSFRSQRIYGMFQSVVRDQRKRRYAQVFQVVEFSIQDNHLHLIVEAVGGAAHEELRAGVSGLVIAFAKRLNMMLGRRGKVWGDRWHGRALPSPREVRSALVYVFRNIAKHGARMAGADLVDPMTSAIRFNGWTRPIRPVFDDPPWPAAPPHTWLLEKGWNIRGGGPIDPAEARRRGA